jgi:long-subunit fatty acid transport protein
MVAIPSARGMACRLMLAALVVALSPAFLVQAQTGDDALRFAQRFPATGARMMGLGGAGIAGIADYTALLSNPAGLAYYQHSMVGGSLNTLSTMDQALFRASTFRGSFDNDVRRTGISNLAYIARAPTTRGSLVFGAAYNQVNTFERELVFEGENPSNSITDFFMPLPGEFTIDVENGNYVPFFDRPISHIAYETWAIDFDAAAYEAGEQVPFFPAVARGTMLQTGRVTEGGSMREASFGGAVEGVQNLMMGLSVNLAFGTYRFDRVFEEDDFQNANDGRPGTVDFDWLRLTEGFESSLVGINVRAGFSSEVTPGIRLGLMLETPTYYSVKENYDTLLETLFDNGDTFVYGDSQGEDAGSGVFEYQVLTPWRLGVGGAFSTGALTLSGDAEFVDWTQLEMRSSDDRRYFNDVNRSIRDNFQAVVNARVGAEYRLGDLALRGGFAYQPDARDSGNLRLTEERVDRSRTFFSAGVGYRFAQQLQVDFGWMQERFDDRYLPYTEVADAPIVDESVVRNRFAVGMRIFF